jgi:ComF family protein
LTGFEKTRDNYTSNLFTGRLYIEKGCSWLFFEKESLTQKLIHQLKYRNNQALGEFLGYTMGKQLAECNWFNDIDVLVPLPLNKRKLNLRGYNQSEVICRGLSDATGLPIEEVAVMRTVYTQTQTRKSRIQRWLNVAEVFDLNESKHLEGKHALLVDDVVTTGATLDACGQVLLKVKGLKLSVLTLAVASRI